MAQFSPIVLMIFPFSVPDKNDKSESTRVSVSDDDERVKLSSDLSDISDAEDGRISVREHCAQRLFSPDIRTELIVDKTLSPDAHRVGPQVPSIPVSLQLCKTNTSSVEAKSVNDTIDRTAPAQSQSHVQSRPTAATSGKPRIWSISEIINSDS